MAIVTLSNGSTVFVPDNQQDQLNTLTTPPRAGLAGPSSMVPGSRRFPADDPFQQAAAAVAALPSSSQDAGMVQEQSQSPAPQNTQEADPFHIAAQQITSAPQAADPFQLAAQQMVAGSSQSPADVIGTPQEHSGLANFAAAALSPFNSLANLGIRGLNAAGIVSDQTARQAIGYTPIPYDPNRTSGKIGSVTGQFGMALAAPEAAPFLFGAQGGEGAMEDIEALQRQGIDPTTSQKLIDIAGQTALQFFVGKLAPGGAVNQALLSKLTPEATSTIARTILRQAITAGVHMPEGMAQQLAANAITKYGGAGGQGINPQQSLGQGVGESGVANAIGAGLIQGVHDFTGGGHTSNDPFMQAAQAIAVPDQATLDSLKTGATGSSGRTIPATSEQVPPVSPPAPTPTPSEPAAPQIEQESKPATPRPLLDSAQPKYRLNDGANSTGVPLTFESPEDKALYLATVPRKGKVANEALSYLRQQGYQPEDIERYGDELRQRIEGLAGKAAVEGHSLDVPALTTESAEDFGRGANSSPTPIKPDVGGQNEAIASLPAGGVAAPTSTNASLPLIDKAKPTWPLRTGAEISRVPVIFDDPTEKLIYLASAETRGKIAAEASSRLQRDGYSLDEINRAGIELRSRMDSLAKRGQLDEGDTLHVPVGDQEATGRPIAIPPDNRLRLFKSEEAENAAPAKGLPAEQGSSNDPAPKATPIETAERSPEAEHLPSDKNHQSVFDEYNPGAKAVDASTLAPEHQEVLADYKALTGKDMIPYTGGRGRGFHMDGDAYYNVERNNTPQLRREVIAHEATHYLQDTKPELVNQMDRALPDSTRKSLLKEYQQMYMNQEGKSLSTDQHTREIQAMAVGRAFSRPSVARAVMEKNPGVFSRAADAVLSKLRGLTSSGRATNEIINFLKTAKGQADGMTKAEPATRRVPETDNANFLPIPNKEIRDQAREYAERAGLHYAPNLDNVPVNEPRAKQIAAHYADLKHEPTNPDVKKSYDAMKSETMDQYHYLQEKGVKFEPWQKEGQPYKDSAGMMKDVADNKHLYFYQGGEMPEDHPLAGNAPGTPYSYNDVFRAVHDYFGHTKEGVGFGPRGEENAWRSHSQMYSEDARPAMTTETRGQNSWVNYGPHGEFNQANPEKTQYAEQKAGLLPEKFTKLDTGLPQHEAAIDAAAKAGGVTPDDARSMIGSFLEAHNNPAKLGLTERKAYNELVKDPEISNGLKSESGENASGATAGAAGTSTAHEVSEGHAEDRAAGLPGRNADGSESPAHHKSGDADTRQADFLPGSHAVKSLVEEDIKPKLKELGENFRDAWEGVKSLLAPQTRGEKGEGALAGRVMRERGGQLARNTDRIHAAFDETEKALDKLPVDQQRAITDAAERGQKQSDPALQPVADAIRQMYDDRLAQIQKIKPDFEGVANYMGHNYTDPKKATDTLLGLMRRPLEGTKGFLRQRYFPYQSDAIAAGLEPTTDNPVTMMRQKLQQMDKFIATHNAMNELKGQGLMKRVPARAVGEWKQKGYQQIDDKAGTIMAKPNRRGGVSIAGYWMAPEPVANVINNHLSPGIRSSDKFGGAYRTALAVNHLKNSLQLISGFHLAFATGDTMASKMALGFRQLASGDIGGAVKSAASVASVIHPVVDAYMKGRGVLKEWAEPGSTKNPDYATIAEQYMIAGGRAHMDQGEQGTSFSDTFKQAYQKGNYVGAAVRAVPAGIEQLTKPIMDHIIPALKAGVFHDIAQHELDKLPANASRDAIRKVMGSAQDSVDDRLGEMVYDNTFWNRTAKDVAMATTRSVGWNLGTLRTFGGAAADIAGIPSQIKKGGLKSIQLTNRMAYSAAVPLTTAFIGTLLHRAFTGQMPSNIYDMLNPKTGRKDKDGNDERWAIPSYMKDIGEYAHDIHDAAKQANPALLGRTLSHKTSPLLSEALELMQNKDYYNVKIHNEDDPILKQLKDVGKYELGQDIPFSAKAIAKMAKDGQGARSLLPLIGLNPARRDVTQSAAELRAEELLRQRMPAAPRTTEQVERAQLVRDLADSLHNHDSDASRKIATAYHSGQITDADLEKIRDRQKPGGVLEHAISRLDAPDAMKVWDEATDDERRRIAGPVMAKIRASKVLTMDERKFYMKRLNVYWQSVRGSNALTASAN